MSRRIATESFRRITRWGLGERSRQVRAALRAVAATTRNSRPLPDVDQDMSGTRRRSFPGWLLVVAFVVVPLVEIYVIIQVGQVIGAWWTILLLIADSILGSWLVKREGGRAWRALRTALEERRMPARELADGMLILVGGTLILSPGLRPGRRRAAVHPAADPAHRPARAGRGDQPQARRRLVPGRSGTTAGRPRPEDSRGRDNAPDRVSPTTGWSRARSSTTTPSRLAEAGSSIRAFSARQPPSSCGRWRGAGAPGRSRRRAAARAAR